MPEPGRRPPKRHGSSSRRIGEKAASSFGRLRGKLRFGFRPFSRPAAVIRPPSRPAAHGENSSASICRRRASPAFGRKMLPVATPADNAHPHPYGVLPEAGRGRAATSPRPGVLPSRQSTLFHKNGKRHFFGKTSVQPLSIPQRPIPCVHAGPSAHARRGPAQAVILRNGLIFLFRMRRGTGAAVTRRIVLCTTPHSFGMKK